MKILHIAPDEKFINSIQWQFEKLFPGTNKYFIFLSSKEKEAKYVQESKYVKFCLDNQNSFNDILKELPKYNLVILHGLKYFQSRIVLKASAGVKFIWFFWGGEIYDNPMAKGIDLLGPKTHNISLKKGSKKTLKEVIRPLYYPIRFGTSLPETSILKAAQKIQYLGVIHNEEVEYLKKNGFIGNTVEHIPMTYYPLEFIFKGIEDITVSGDNILLGNSASLTNNHLEAFETLKEKNLGDRKLVVPLSYGDQDYAEEICILGKEMFGEKFSPLRDFMSLEEYNTILSTCNVVLMNHFRQQAVGNILAMLWMGAKVYLNESNTFFHYLKRLGITVYSINKDFEPGDSAALQGLDLDQIENNRKILLKAISFKATGHGLNKKISEIAHAD